MRINYFLPFTAHTGGVAVIFEHARRLAERGHDATVTVPTSQLGVDWCSPEHLIGIGSVEEMRDADVVVATASSSAKLVASLPPSKGEKFYFVQHYETLWSGNVDHTYRLPMNKIVVSTWLRRVMEESFDQPAFVVPPAIDHGVFRPDGHVGGAGKRVLVMDHILRILKGTWVAIQAVKLAQRKMADLELVVFGTDPKERGFGPVAEWRRHPMGQELAELYRSCDVFLFPTVAEGFGLPPLEAMACGTPVVTTDHTGTSEYANPEAAFIAPVHDVRATSLVLLEALSDEGRRAKVAEAGMRKAAEFTWDATIDKLEEAFTRGWGVSTQG